MVTDTPLVTLGALVAPQHMQSFLTRLDVAQHCSTCKQCLQLLCQVAYSSAEEPLGWYTIAVWIFDPSYCCFHPGVLWEMEMMDTSPLCYILIEVGANIAACTELTDWVKQFFQFSLITSPFLRTQTCTQVIGLGSGWVWLVANTCIQISNSFHYWDFFYRSNLCSFP